MEGNGLPVHRHEIGIDALVQLGRTLDERRREGDVASPLSEEAARIMASGVPTDDSATLRDLGVRYRPLTETFSDAVAFLRRRGLIAAPVGEA
jgi:UDP-glucose 4-epimerase